MGYCGINEGNLLKLLGSLLKMLQLTIASMFTYYSVIFFDKISRYKTFNTAFAQSFNTVDPHYTAGVGGQLQYA
jgi:hypothetical protein